MENKTARTCKTTAIVCGILGFIGSISLSGALANRSNYEFFGVQTHSEFDFGTFLCMFLVLYLSVFILCLLIYAAGEALELLERIRHNTEKTVLLSATDNSTPVSSVSNSKSDLLSESKHTTGNGDWFCNNCGTRNSKSFVFCKDCGSYK